MIVKIFISRYGLVNSQKVNFDNVYSIIIFFFFLPGGRTWLNEIHSLQFVNLSKYWKSNKILFFFFTDTVPCFDNRNYNKKRKNVKGRGQSLYHTDIKISELVSNKIHRIPKWITWRGSHLRIKSKGGEGTSNRLIKIFKLKVRHQL